MRRLRQRLPREGEAGLTLIELLVAAAMSTIIIGAAALMLTSVLRQQPRLSKASQNVSTARFVLERMTREIRTGVVVEEASSSTVAFRVQSRHTSCGASTIRKTSEPSITCRVTYSCASTYCTRAESETGKTGTAVKIFSGINSGEAFSYYPDGEEPTFVGVTLRFPDPDGSGVLNISDGAALRGQSPFGAS